MAMFYSYVCLADGKLNINLNCSYHGEIEIIIRDLIMNNQVLIMVRFMNYNIQIIKLSIEIDCSYF